MPKSNFKGRAAIEFIAEKLAELQLYVDTTEEELPKHGRFLEDLSATVGELQTRVHDHVRKMQRHHNRQLSCKHVRSTHIAAGVRVCDSCTAVL